MANGTMRAAWWMVVAILPTEALHGQDRMVDFRYAPDYYHTPIGFPDDWQKTMVNERGSLLLDFGPGPYVRPNTIVGIGLERKSLSVVSQRLQSGSVPVLATEFHTDDGSLFLETFSLVPRESHSGPPVRHSGVTRRLGLTGGISWAHPPPGTDAVFRNVAWGTNRPILYEIEVPPGSKKRIAVGFCESYRTVPGLRMMEMHVEGGEVRTIDPIAKGGRNLPVVEFFDAHDRDRNGRLTIEARASAECRDPNIILNGIWVFPEGRQMSGQDVISGAARKRAELVIDCGLEPQVKNFPTRMDALRVTRKGSSAALVASIQSSRSLEYDSSSGVLNWEGRPFIAARPRPSTARRSERGWELVFPEGADLAEILAIHGHRLPRDIARIPDLAEERKRTIQWWSASNIPSGRVELPDRQMQLLFDASVRTLYQNRDNVDGRPNFQPGSTVYRGLWIHDGVYYMELAAMLGDTASARRAVEGLFRFQDASGKVKVMFPIEMQRETPMMVWVVGRYARLADNREWLLAHWDRVVSAVAHIRKAREETLKDRTAPYSGLMPPGFVDGGIAGLTADYSTVFWTLIGLEAALDMATWLGDEKHLREWRSLYSELLASFRNAAQRDSRRDRFGNLYLPVRVADTSSVEAPQRAQWAICEAIMLSSVFPQDDSLAAGSLALLDSSCVQGLPATLGWMDGGIGVWFAPLYGLAHFIQGNTRRAIDVLYAFANHATPHGAWAEEQMPKGVSSRTTGDFPTTSASACMLRSVLYMLAYERGNTLELLKGLPPSWLTAGASVRLNSILTRFGPVGVTVSVSNDSRKATISISSKRYGDQDDSMAQYTDSAVVLRVSLSPFHEAGFTQNDGNRLAESIIVPWNQKVAIEVQR